MSESVKTKSALKLALSKVHFFLEMKKPLKRPPDEEETTRLLSRPLSLFVIHGSPWGNWQ